MRLLDARGSAPMGFDHARSVIAGLGSDLYFDYLYGRVLKVDLSGDVLDGRLYDRDMGEGAAARVVSEVSRPV